MSATVAPATIPPVIISTQEPLVASSEVPPMIPAAPPPAPISQTNPAHHDFYRQNYMSWATLMKQPLRRTSPNQVMPGPVELDEVEAESMFIAPPENLVLDPINMIQTRQIIYTIGIIGIFMAMFAISLIIGVIALVNALKPSKYGTATSLISIDDKWLFCDGSAVSRAKYRDLFLVIGTNYGVGDGVDTFNLPDLRNRFIYGTSASTTSQMTFGGSTLINISIPNLPAHTHDQGTLVTASTGSHTHTINDPSHSHSMSNANSGGSNIGYFGGGNSAVAGSSHAHTINSATTGITVNANGAHTHTITGSTGSVGSGQSIEFLPPFMTMHYVIRA